MTQPEAPPQPEVVIQAAVGLADTPLGQRVAITLTILVGKDAAKGIADAVTKLADSMSASGLVVAAPNGNGIPKAPA